ncbi:hypothetical protein FPOAC2_05331 [Fusarium poae]|jgi:hypothetical protein|uniref:hypothetical protein n=1 Tax=Fusarium poae TaxID=36050 RepID=UPI001CEACD74|nr:hypothetical protein FPOAC1_005226 [Fusarium poae]KAG8671967.1 hypothetical protein FPOAC1_005226 [Fusarium poae]
MKRTIFASSLRATVPSRRIQTTFLRAASDTAESQPTNQSEQTQEATTSTTDATKKVAHKKTSAELDQELREKLEAFSGEGGGAGVEYEGGKAEGLKRGVKSNMFRVI